MARIDKSRVAILVKEPGKFNQLVDKLKAQGLKVDIYSSVQSLFSALSEVKPGFILCSKAYNETSFGSQFPSFLHRKYKVPVLPLTENIASDQENGVLHLHSDTKAQDILDSLNKQKAELASQEKRRVSLKSKKLNQLSREEKVERFSDEIWSEITQDLEETLAEWGDDQKMKTVSVKIQTPEHTSLSLISIPLTATATEVSLAKLNTLNRLKKMYPNAEIEVDELKAELSVEDTKQLVAEFQKHTSVTGENMGTFLLSTHVVVNDAQSEYVTGGDSEIQEDGVGFKIPLEDWLTLKGVKFRLYLWLEFSKKKITYIKNGRSLIIESLQRFKKKGIGTLHIDKEDLETYKIQRFVRRAS